MSGENNLQVLLTTMKPKMQRGAFIFLTAKELSNEAQKNAVMIFAEAEGTTAIVHEEHAPMENQPKWAMITLTVHSDLHAVGFLAAITAKLAAGGISVNPVSAFFHDHLFVPWEKRNEAMEILHSFQSA